MRKNFVMYLVFSLLIAMSLAYGVNAEVVSGNCGEDGDNVKWELDTENGVLTISGQGDMWDYEYQYDYSGGYTTAPWYSCYPGISTVVIQNGITSIGNFAFYGCTGLTSIVIPGSVTSIGMSVFNRCTDLTNVTIPDGVTSIGNHVFASCTGLTNITIPDGVTSIGNSAFFGCTGLTSVTIPAGVAKMSVLAFDSTQLTDIYYGGTETEWKNMMNMVGGGNDPLFQATLHCVPELPNQLVLTIGQRTAHAFGHTKINDVAPVVVNGRTMLPVRFLAENLGATVAWNEEKQLVTITGKNQKQEDVTILITIGAANAQINGQSVALEAPAFVDQNRTFMPVRLIAEALGASVDWNEAEQKVIITKM